MVANMFEITELDKLKYDVDLENQEEAVELLQKSLKAQAENSFLHEIGNIILKYKDID